MTGRPRELPVLGPGEARSPSTLPPVARGPSRSADRRITAGGIAVACTFILLGGLATLLPPDRRHGTWLPLHLVLAGGAGTAIAALMPFFTAALAAAPPAPPRLRVTAISLVAIGAFLVTASYAGGHGLVAGAGASLYLLGLVAVAAAAWLPLRRGLVPRGGIVAVAYSVAILDVLVGVALATAFVTGDRAVADAWGAVKPAHAWLNLLGFVALVVAGTLLHLLPTVLGTRIRRRRSATVTVVGLAVGAPLVAAGFLTGRTVIAQAGAIAAMVGALALVTYAISCLADRGRWTTDIPWHRFAMGSLLAGVAWFATGMLVAGGRILWMGVTPDAWLLAPIAGPLAVGWVAQTIIGSVTHLLPAVGPGDPVTHATQRRLLGIAGVPRVVTLQLGTAMLTIGMAGASLVVTSAGMWLVLVVAGADLALLAIAAVRPVRWWPTPIR